MERGMDTLLVQKDTTEGTELIRSNLEFIKDIFKNKQINCDSYINIMKMTITVGSIDW